MGMLGTEPTCVPPSRHTHLEGQLCVSHCPPNRAPLVRTMRSPGVEGQYTAYKVTLAVGRWPG